MTSTHSSAPSAAPDGALNGAPRNASASRPRTTYDLETCIHVTPPSVWVALIAFVALLSGLLSWAVFGTIDTKITATGAMLDGRVVCFLSKEDVATVNVGDSVKILTNTNVGDSESKKDLDLSVEACPASPISRGEIQTLFDGDYSNYLVDALVEDDWSYMVLAAGDTSSLDQDVPLALEITTERIAPISLILGSAT